MAENSRRRFLKRAAMGGAAVAVASPAPAQEKPAKKVFRRPSSAGAAPATNPPQIPILSTGVFYGNLLFISAIEARFEGTIQEHTKYVLDEIEKRLQEAGSSMEKALKVTVFLSDIKDYAAMNEVYRGRFGGDPPARTTVAASGIPGNSKVAMDCVAYV